MNNTPPHVDVFFSYRSPYSYLAIQRLSDWAEKDGIDLEIRPVLPLAILNPKYFTDANPLMVPYVFNDVERNAEFHNITFAWPHPDPIVMEFDPVHIPDEQPYIHRLTRLGVEAGRRGRSLEFTLEVTTMMWGGTVEKWTDGDHLGKSVERAGLDLIEMDQTIENDPDLYIKIIEANHAARHDIGHWGSPTIVIEGEPFFGQDRIELAKWRLAQIRSAA